MSSTPIKNTKTLKVAVIGAGSTYTPELIEGIIKRRDVLPLHEIALMDIDERKLGIVGGLCKRMLDHEDMGCKYVQTMDLDEAIAGADFVFAQIRVGKLAARILDEKIPLKYNLIGQETTGIGGFFKALRTVPVLLDIARRMERLCPNAVLINFSNPSGICAQALSQYSSIKSIGLCNGPIGMVRHPLRVLGLSREDVELEFLGLNHLSFVSRMVHNGRDLIAEAVHNDEALLDTLADSIDFPKESMRMAQALPVGYLNYFITPGDMLDKLASAPQSRGEVCLEIEEELLKMYQDDGLYVKPELLSKRGGALYSEAAVSLAESIWQDDGGEHIVNVRNNGAIPFMADDDVVETRTNVYKNGAVPIPVTTDNVYIKTMMQTLKGYERLAVEAAVNGNRAEAIRALCLNPLIHDVNAATACFDEMLAAHKQYLPNFYK